MSLNLVKPVPAPGTSPEMFVQLGKGRLSDFSLVSAGLDGVQGLKLPGRNSVTRAEKWPGCLESKEK